MRIREKLDAITPYQPARSWSLRIKWFWFNQTRRRKRLTVLFLLSLSLTLLTLLPEVQPGVQRFAEQTETALNQAVAPLNQSVMRRVFPLLSRFRITSPYGMRIHPVLGVPRLHDGIDFATPTGTPVLSPVKGRVIRAGGTRGTDGPFTGYGLLVEIEYGDKETVFFAHLDQILVKVGEMVQAGQLVARSGGTGLGTGEHLHLGYSKNNQSRNPDFMNRWAVISSPIQVAKLPEPTISTEAYFKVVIAAVNTIYTTEGTYYRENPYNVQYTGRIFQGFRDHPFVNRNSPDQIDHVKPLPCGNTQAGRVCSAASGAGQWMPNTWLSVERTCPLLKQNKDPDRFSPQRQDLAMVCVLNDYGFWRRLFANSSVKNNRVVLDRDSFNQAIYSVAGEWASLPTDGTDTSGAHGQGAKSSDRVWQIFNKRLGELYN
ncbi:peptidoglycan DD-metalloendopeptidase family protein [Leptolyngbya sp. AN03gr2]|uniref:peptidoglycan DD-metalloendopeptidase family protein n=1 Tax=Leptolyngbya sp. AN03gr2 TaxID=3423364 RepID=UPI003D317AF5